MGVPIGRPAVSLMLSVCANQTTRSSGPVVDILKFLALWMMSLCLRLGMRACKAVATSLNTIATCASAAAPERDRNLPLLISTMRPMLPSMRPIHATTSRCFSRSRKGGTREAVRFITLGRANRIALRTCRFTLDWMADAGMTDPPDPTFPSFRRRSMTEPPWGLDCPVIGRGRPARSTCGEVEPEVGAPGVQLRESPASGFHRDMFVPGPGLAHPEFRDELVHFGIELDHHLIGVVVVGGHVVARGVPRRAPEKVDAGGAQRIGCAAVLGTFLELVGDVVDPRVRRLHDIDDVVVAIAGEEVRDPRDVVGENEAEKVLEERDQLVAFGGDDRHVAEAQQRCAGLLEAGNRSFDRVVELDDHAARRLDFDQFGDAGLTVGLDCRGEAKLARVASEVAD